MSDFVKDTNVPTNDCISRQDALDAIDRVTESHNSVDAMKICAEVRLELLTLPHAEPKTAVWVGEGDGYVDGEIILDTWYCSNCDYCPVDDEKPNWNYCPNCGAKMEVIE